MENLPQRTDTGEIKQEHQNPCQDSDPATVAAGELESTGSSSSE